MKFRIVLITTWILFAFTNNGYSQLKPLKVGDKLPEVFFKQVYNYKSKQAKFSDLKTKIIILDFWSTSCKSCIELFPHMQSLKDEFKDQLQIILVNGKTKLWKDDEIKTKKILDIIETKTGVKIKLPIVFNSNELDNYFPWQTIPHEVWVNDKGIVIAITGADAVNEKNISAILRGEQVTLRTKKDVLYDYSKTTLAQIVYGSEALNVKSMYSSTLIKGAIDGIGSQNGRVRSGEMYTRSYISNHPLLDLYKSIYSSKINFPVNNRIIIDVKDSNVIWKVRSGDPDYYDNLYSYDVSAPPTTIENLFSYAQQDLERTFHTTVTKEKRKIKCWVLRATDETEKIFSKGGERAFELGETSAKKFVRNYPLPDFMHELNANYFDIPLIDETRITTNVDIEMPYVLNQENIIEALKKSGFEIKQEERELEVVAITDKK